MKRKTVMRCTATILTILLMLLTTISVFAVEKFDRKNFSDPKKFRITATNIGSWYDKSEDDNTFGTLSVRYVIDNMDGDKWISEAWAQKVLFRLVKTPAYLRDFGPGRTFTKVEKAYGTDNVLGKNEETTIDLDEGRYYTATGKEWWAANGRHAKSWFINDTYVNMRCSLHLKEEEPIDDFLKEVEKSYLEGGAEYEENTVEELRINGRRVLLKKRYEPLEFYQSKDYMVDSHIYTKENSSTIWDYTTIIEFEEFPEIYLSTTTKVSTSFRYEKTDASGEIDQYAEDLYQDYLKQLETANNEVALEMINIEPEVIYLEPVIGKTVGKKESNKPGSFVIGTKADKDKGETSTSIPEALAIVIIGGATAIIGAGTGGGSDDSSKKKKSRYKMCLCKDFGDAIRYDTQPVTVYARIVEITPEGEEIDRPDLSARIEMFSSGGLKVESTAMADNYMGALVCAESVPGGQNPDSGVLSIRFSGEGGSFQNNVTFRLVGKPYISFPERGDYLTMTLPMLLGDGEVYETPVILNDFLEKPTSLRLDVAEDVPLSCKLEETEEANETRYLLKVKNLSAKPETPQAVKLMFGIGILAENDKEKAEESVNAELYPEGLSIREVKFDEKGYVLIDTFDNEATDEWGDVVPTDFVLDFAVPEKRDDGRRIVRVLAPKDFSPAFGGLKGTDERTARLAERFRYTIQETQGNLKAYEFAPQEALVEEKGKPYYLTLPISCAYGQEKYTLDLPIRLLGGGPGPLAGWDEAFADMKKIVSKVGGISPEIAGMLRENGKKMSTAELRLVTRKICHDAIIYYTKDAAEYEQIAAELDNMLFYAEWMKWFGDQAFSYLISTYYGNTADALLSPAKDIFAAFLGEVIDWLLYDEEINLDELETIKNITAGVDNLITNAFDDVLDDVIEKKEISLKQVCAVAAGFLVWKIGKNIYENRDKDGKIDLYSAITALTADLTAMGVKKIAGIFFNKALESSAVQNALNKPINKWLQNIVPNMVKGRWVIDEQGEYLLKIVEFKQSDIIKKYLEEIFGAGAAKVVEMGAEAAQDWLNSTGSGETPVDLSAWPRISWIIESKEQNGKKVASMISVDLSFEAVGKFFDYLFGELFGEVPFATETKSLPVDPPYLPEKSFDTL
jgi:hypothetical protein